MDGFEHRQSRKWTVSNTDSFENGLFRIPGFENVLLRTQFFFFLLPHRLLLCNIYHRRENSNFRDMDSIKRGKMNSSKIPFMLMVFLAIIDVAKNRKTKRRKILMIE